MLNTNTSLSYRTINDEIPPFLRMRKELTYLLTYLLTMAKIADMRLSIAFMSASLIRSFTENRRRRIQWRRPFLTGIQKTVLIR